MQPMRMMTIITKEPQAPKELIDHIIRPGLRDIELDVIGYADGHRVYRFHNPRGEEYCEGTHSPGVGQFDGEKSSQWMQEIFEIGGSGRMRGPLVETVKLGYDVPITPCSLYGRLHDACLSVSHRL